MLLTDELRKFSSYAIVLVPSQVDVNVTLLKSSDTLMSGALPLQGTSVEGAST